MTATQTEVPRYYVDDRTTLTFACQGNRPNATLWLEIQVVEDAEPENLYADLAAIGWTEDTKFGKQRFFFDAYVLDEDYKRVKQGFRTDTVHISGPKGSDLFGAWNAEERKRYVAAARAVLRKYDFVRVPIWKKTLQDML